MWETEQDNVLLQRELLKDQKTAFCGSPDKVAITVSISVIKE